MKTITVNTSIMRWKMFKELFENGLHCNGVIFGGAIRDKILHDHGAQLFYKTDHTTSEYIDPECHVESIDRLIIPNDIDIAFYKREHAEQFKRLLEKRGYIIVNNPGESIEESDDSNYCREEDGMMHLKWKIEINTPLFIKCYTQNILPQFQIDVLLPKIGTERDIEDLPPFGNGDFECNALACYKSERNDIVTTIKKIHLKSGELNSFKISEYVDIITKDICNKKTYIINAETPKYRYEHMLAKGFSIHSWNLSIFPEKEKDDTCLLCNTSEGTFVSTRCCNLKYNIYCFKELINFNDNFQCCNKLYLSCQDIKMVQTLCDIDNHTYIDNPLYTDNESIDEFP